MAEKSLAETLEYLQKLGENILHVVETVTYGINCEQLHAYLNDNGFAATYLDTQHVCHQLSEAGVIQRDQHRNIRPVSHSDSN